MSDADRWEEILFKYRPSLVAFAFRMLGSLSEAEDLVQETFLETTQVDAKRIVNHRAWLMKVCANKAINQLKKAYKRRESYPGVWLPDQVPEALQIWRPLEGEVSPEKALVLSEGLTTTFLTLLEKLSPSERAVFLLSDIFDYSFKEIAEIIKKSEIACRKTSERARTAIQSNRPKFSKPPKSSEEILKQFFEAAKMGDAKKLMELFAKDAQLWGDGGGQARAAGLITGIERIVKFYLAWRDKEIYDASLFQTEFHNVNSRPGIIISKKLSSGYWCFDTILSFEFVDGKIARIYGQRNPERLLSLLKWKSN